MAVSRSRLLAAALLAAACAAAAAQERAQLPIQLTASSLNYDSQKGVVEYEAVTITQGEVRISADRAVATGVDFKDSTWEFRGVVRISTPEAALASDTASVRFAGGEVAAASVTGAPATFEQRRNDELARGRANRIDYDLQRGTVELGGNAWLSDGKTEMTGGKLVYSTANQRVVSRDPVTITIQPGEQPAARPDPVP
jgi:lipopolysaccharide transport protein LptA